MNPLRVQVRKVLRKCALAIVILTMLVGLLALTAPWYLITMYDTVLVSGELPSLVLLTTVALILLTISGFADAVRSKELVRQGRDLEKALGGAVFGHTFGNGVTDTERREPMIAVQTLSKFCSSSALTQLLELPLFTPLSLFVLWCIHPAFLVVGIGAIAVMLLIAYLSNWASRASLAEYVESNEHDRCFCDAAWDDRDSIRSMGLIPAVVSRWQDFQQRTLENYWRSNVRLRLFYALAKDVRQKIQIVVLCTGAYYAVLGEINMGAIIAASVLLGRAIGPIDEIINIVDQVKAAFKAFRTLDVFFNEQQPEKVTLEAEQVEVTVDGLSFAYSESEVLWEGVSFVCQPGKITAITGESGAGKSTLLRVILGIEEPLAGEVRINGALGTRYTLGNRVGYVPQSVPTSFLGSVASYFARYAEPDPQAVREAAQLAGIHERIIRMSDGYETELGFWATLSGGEMERFALARAFYENSPLIVLDEPDNGLDEDLKETLIAALRQARQRGATIIIASHEPQLIDLADRVVRVKQKKARVTSKSKPRQPRLVSA